MVLYAPLGPSDDPQRERDSRELGEILGDVRKIRFAPVSLAVGEEKTVAHGSRSTPVVFVQSVGTGVAAELRGLTATTFTVGLSGAGSGAFTVLVAIIEPE